MIFSIAFKDVSGRIRHERTKAMSRTLARRLLALKEDAVEQARARGFDSVDRLTPAPVPTLRAFAEKTYLPHVKATRAASTLREYKRELKATIYPKLGHRRLDEIRPADVQAFLDARVSENKDLPRTVSKIWGVLSGLFSAAVKRDIIGKNPARGVARPRIEESLARCLTDAEIAALLAKVTPHLREIICFALETALRDSELRHLTWADYNAEQKAILIRGTKSHRDRLVPLSPAALAIVKARETARGLPTAGGSPFVFVNPNSGTGWTYHFTSTREWIDALEAAGFRARFHDLRHTCITRWVRQGHPLAAIQKIAGHSRITQTAHYCRLDQADLRAVVDPGSYHRHYQTAPPPPAEAQ